MGLLVDAHYWEVAARISGSVTLDSSEEAKMPVDAYGIMTCSRMKW